MGEPFHGWREVREERGKSVAFQISGSDNGQLLEPPARPIGLCISSTRPEQRAESSQRPTSVGEPSAFPLTGFKSSIPPAAVAGCQLLEPAGPRALLSPYLTNNPPKRQQQTRRTISRRSNDALRRGDAESLRRMDIMKCDARSCGRQPLTPPKPIGPSSPLQPIRILLRLLTGAESRLLSDG